jgi:hypothetical protein
MMSKIVQAANVMITRKNLITNVSQGDNEIFFTYNDKYNWSVSRRDGDVALWYYPKSDSLDDLVSRSYAQAWEEVPMIHYKVSDLGTREAAETFGELYRTVKEKMFGVDDVLDDIIKDDPF